MLVMFAGSSRTVQGCAVGAASALPFGVAATLYFHWWDFELAWSAAIPLGVVAGVLFGLLMGLVMPRAATRITGALAELTYTQRRQAVRATRRGPAPDDPEVRAAAVALLDERRRLQEGRQRNLWILLAFLVVYSLLMALLSSPWWWLGVAFYGSAFVADQWLRRSMPKRMAVLGATAAL